MVSSEGNISIQLKKWWFFHFKVGWNITEELAFGTRHHEKHILPKIYKDQGLKVNKESGRLVFTFKCSALL
ncbi:hypothetical protein CN925_08470 [Bacillus sp. AFS055030]|nr:hypothetical protein CN925_08470 [Bacillus sp. AFS055030]